MKIGFLSALGLLFIGLKLGGVIAWSWWLVLLPIWGPVAVWLVVLAGLLGLYGLACLLGDKEVSWSWSKGVK